MVAGQAVTKLRHRSPEERRRARAARVRDPHHTTTLWPKYTEIRADKVFHSAFLGAISRKLS